MQHCWMLICLTVGSQQLYSMHGVPASFVLCLIFDKGGPCLGPRRSNTKSGLLFFFYHSGSSRKPTNMSNKRNNLPNSTPFFKCICYKTHRNSPHPYLSAVQSCLSGWMMVKFWWVKAVVRQYQWAPDCGAFLWAQCQAGYAVRWLRPVAERRCREAQ